MGGSSKSGSSGTQTYDYYGTLAGGLCVGPVSELISVILDGQEAWPRGTPWVAGTNMIPGTLYVFDAQTWTCTTAHVASAANAPGSGLMGWTEFTFKYHGSPYDDFSLYASDGTFQGVFRLYWGTSAQTADYYLQSANNNGGVAGHMHVGDQHPDYKGVCYCVLIDFLLGEEIQSGPNLEVVLRRKPNQTLVTGNAALISDGQANLAAVLAEILTDPNCLGLPATMVDTMSFNTVASYLDANGVNYNASVLIDSAEALRSVLDKIIQMFDGFIRFNSATQKVELGVYEHGVAPATYINVETITADMLTKHPKFDTTSWQGTFSRATVRYNSRQLNYQQTSVYADDPRAFFVLGVTRDQALDRPYIAREGQALFHGREALRVIGHAKTNGEIEVRREFGRLVRAGDFVFVDVDLEPGGNSVYQYFRITQRKIPPTGPITLELFADNTLSTVPFSTPYPITPPGSAVISPLAAVRAVQIPDFLSGEHNAITVLAQRPDNLIAGCQLYFDTARKLSVSLVSLVADSTGTIGILTFAAAPGFAIGDAIDVGGVTNGDPFNVSQAAVTYATGTVVKYALNGSVTASLAATGTIAVADYFTTFSNLGTITNFAAKASLHTALTASATTLDVDVDTTQADADYFTQQYTSNDAAGDTMLAFIISLVASGGDAGQIAESGGFGIIEICSISSQTLTGTGRYSLAVLRGRQGTNATAFTTANTEVWIVPRSMLTYFVSGAFDLIRANRILNTVPQYAQFRFCPFNYAGVLPLSSAANDQFRFPLKSAGVPTLALTTSPASSYSGPKKVEVAGTWTDSDSNLVEVKILLRLSSESTDRVILDDQFAQCGSYSFDKRIVLDASGSWTIKLIATDATGMTTEQDIGVTITGGVATCATPDVFDCNGNQILNAGGTDYTGIGIKSPFSNANVSAWGATPTQFIPFGLIQISCSTPGANIVFYTLGPSLAGNIVSVATPATTQYVAGSACPFHSLMNPGTVTTSTAPMTTASAPLDTYYYLYVMATAPGYAASLVLRIRMPLFI